jgi:hypothetical protein
VDESVSKNTGARKAWVADLRGSAWLRIQRLSPGPGRTFDIYQKNEALGLGRVARARLPLQANRKVAFLISQITLSGFFKGLERKEAFPHYP